MEAFIPLFKEGGLVLVFAVVICFVLFSVIKHFLDQNEKIFNAFVSAQAEFLKVNAGWQRALDAHNANAIEFHSRASEADRFQRDEHREICAGLANLSTTFREEHNKRHEEIVEVKQGLKAIEKVMEKCEG